MDIDEAGEHRFDAPHARQRAMDPLMDLVVVTLAHVRRNRVQAELAET